MRVLVVGDPSSSLEYVAKKLTTLNAKAGPFAFALLTHPPAASPTRTSPPSFPIPTFYASQHPPSTPAPSLNNTGPAAALSHSSLNVLLIAAGYDDPPSAATAPPPEIAAALKQAGSSGAGFRGVDVLVAPTPPRGVSLPRPEGAPRPSSLIARVAAAARPRYHFCGASKFVELAPFVVPGAVAATRFFALAAACKAKKGAPEAPRWLYAANVQPLAGMSVPELAATRVGMLVTCPYDAGENKRRVEMLSGSEIGVAKRPRRPVRAGRQSTTTPRDAKCWFCLASGKDTHLVLAVGEHFYVAAAKGGLIPEHVLIVPVNHVHSGMDPKMTEEMREEVELWKSAIRQWFRKDLDVGAYFFERAVFTRGGWDQMHMHIQCIPMKKCEDGRKAVEGVAKEWDMKGVEIFAEGTTCLERLQQLFKEREGAESAEKAFEYFWGELPDATCVVQSISAVKLLVAANDSAADSEIPIVAVDRAATDGSEHGKDPEASAAGGAEKTSSAEEGKRLTRPSAHPLHFGRKIATVLLDLPDRVDWKSCVGMLREEQRTANRVRASFAPFEPPEFDTGDDVSE